MTDLPPSSPSDRDYREWRDARRDERRRFRRDMGWRPGGGSWVVGLVLIAIGSIFLAQNFGYPVPHNWWAFFLLIPAMACFGGAWSMYQRSGRQVTPPVTSTFLTGLVLTGLAAVFLLGIDLGKFWPVILIVVGVAALFGGRRWGPNPPPNGR